MAGIPVPSLALGPWPGVTVEVRRCAAGRLRNAYPVSTHDVEVRIQGRATPEVFTDVLGTAARTVFGADPHCRRVVFAAPAGEPGLVAAAEAAGFRHVVDVDVPGMELSLVVAEPEWVTQVDIDLDRVPGS